MNQFDDPSTIIALGFGPYDSTHRGKYSLLHSLRRISEQYQLGAMVECADTRFGAMEMLKKYATGTTDKVRVETGELENPVDHGPPRTVVLWPKFEQGGVRMLVFSNVTKEDYVKSRVLMHGDDYARTIIRTGPTKIVLLYKDSEHGDISLPCEEMLRWDYEDNGLFYLPRDVRSKQSLKASADAMGNLVKGLWERGRELPYDEYMEIASSAVVKC